ncbi:MAG: DUF3108 domain-containing protein [Rhodomicrobium sp.]
MAKRLLLWEKRQSLAGAVFLSLSLPFNFIANSAVAEADGGSQSVPAPEQAASAPKGEGAAAAAPASTPAAPAPANASVTGTNGNASPEPKLGQAGEKPAEAKPAGPKEVKGEAKPTEAKPLKIRPPEPKEASTEADPKDITPKTENSENLAIKASVVNALYHINWLGTHIGDFKIRSSITNRQYSLQANADLSIFFGAVSWQGVTSSRGLMTANGPVPQNYTFRYSTNDRREAVEIRFQQRMVQDIIINPPAHPGSRNVPITAAHLQNVVDPLSAIVLLSQARLSRHGGDACNKRLPIFDGRVRYDLVLSPKGTRSIGNSGKLHGIAYVCRVSYVPIAGHKAGRSNDYTTGNTGIEVWLVPLPEAGLLIPYYVHVPTPAGTASMVTAKFDIETAAGRHALAD